METLLTNTFTCVAVGSLVLTLIFACTYWRAKPKLTAVCFRCRSKIDPDGNRISGLPRGELTHGVCRECKREVERQAKLRLISRPEQLSESELVDHILDAVAVAQPGDLAHIRVAIHHVGSQVNRESLTWLVNDMEGRK